MLSKLAQIISDLRETREQVAFLRNNLGIGLGEIQVGYECAIEDLLELFGLSEKQIDLFWELSEPDEKQS